MKPKISYSLFNTGIKVTAIIRMTIFIACFMLFWVFDAKTFHEVFFRIMTGLFVFTFMLSLFFIHDSLRKDDNIKVYYRR